MSRRYRLVRTSRVAAAALFLCLLPPVINPSVFSADLLGFMGWVLAWTGVMASGVWAVLGWQIIRSYE